MGIWNFGRDKNKKLDPARAEASAQVLRTATAERERMAKPAVRLQPSQRSGRSHMGGSPLLPPGFEWPRWKAEPLDHVAQIDLSQLHAAVANAPDWLPRTGLLTFFYGPDQSAWGFDPADEGSWRVFLHDGSGLVGTPPPAGEDDVVVERYPPLFVEFVAEKSHPQDDRLSDIVDFRQLTDHDELEWEKLTDVADGGIHRIGGYPDPVQQDMMELECQLASNGIYLGDAKGYQDPRAAALHAGAADWRLLLQLDSDDDAGMMWGDAGRLYFWVREQDAHARDSRRCGWSCSVLDTSRSSPATALSRSRAIAQQPLEPDSIVFMDADAGVDRVAIDARA